jgi:hypothetical protein
VRFEIISALVVGALLPILETTRRGIAYWTVNITTMFEDYIAGGLLLIAAFLAIRGKPSAPLFLVAAWSYVTGMMSSSFWYQLESTIRGVDLEPRNSAVLGFKILLWATCVISVLLSLRRVMSQSRTPSAERSVQ